MIPRTITTKVQLLAKQFPAIAILGPRQSGKTTLVRKIFAKKPYVSLEELDNREFATSDPRGFLTPYEKTGAIFDEVQRVPTLLSYLQTIIDQPGDNGRFILTGSHNYLLQHHVSQTLAGRVALLTLLPFSLKELFASQPHQTLEHSLFFGCYPRIYDQHLQPGDWYPSYIQTYLERDVRLIKNITDLHAFQKFMKLCAGRIGQVLNLSSLANDCGITHNTAKAWLSVLESSYIIFLLQPHYKNFSKRLIKMPKLYFYDTGLACALLNITTQQQVSTHYLYGSLFESFITSELLKARYNQGKQPNCYFWRDRQGHEIDCVLEDDGKLIPIEIKAGKTITTDYFTGLNYWTRLAGISPQHGYLIYGGDQSQQRQHGHVLAWRDVEKITP